MNTGAVFEYDWHGPLSRCVRENDEDNPVLGKSSTDQIVAECDSCYDNNIEILSFFLLN